MLDILQHKVLMPTATLQHIKHLLFWHSATRKLLQVLYANASGSEKNLVPMESVQAFGQQPSLARNSYGLNYSHG